MNDTTAPPPRPTPSLGPLLSVNEDDDYDAWVLAGGRLFRAHASVLASHSAYLRGAAVGGVTGARGDIRLLLPHVPPAGFAAILTYMYTGRLPVTPATLYEVLLAGHLLQMAGVVSLCQALLTTSTSSTTEGGAGLGVSPDLPSLPPALSVWRGLARLVPPPPHHPHQHPTAASPSSSALTLPATIVRPTPTRARPLHPPLDLTREPEAMETDTGGGEERNDSAPLHHHPTSTTTQLQQPSTAHLHHAFRDPGDREDKVTVGRAGAVVLDVATCDGPVFFERVINRAYKANPLLGPDDSETETEINVEEVDSSEDTSGRPPLASHSSEDRSRDGLATLLRIPATSTTKGDSKAQSQPPQRSSSPPIPNNTLSRTYHCVYCNHTFKSHYCYQKHMRRHINPITVEVDKPRPSALTTTTTNTITTTTNTSPNSQNDTVPEGNSSAGPAGGGSGSGGGGSAKSRSTSPYSNCTVSPAPSSEGLKILDLNVQYFPCKTCGSKFPSYYFVHKHRRLCHQDEENAAASYGKKSAPTPSTPPSSTASTPTPRPPTPVPVAPPLPPLDTTASPTSTTVA